MSVPNHLFTSYHSKNATMGANAEKQRFDLCCLIKDAQIFIHLKESL